MSNILIGYAKINSPSNIDICMTELLSCAKKEGVGIWFNSDVHPEEIVDEYREKKEYLIFSITDTFEYENIHRLLWSDLCRAGEGEQICSLEEDVLKIISLLRILLSYTDQIDLFVGNYGCFSYEYDTIINVNLDNLGTNMINYINCDNIVMKHFIIG